MAALNDVNGPEVSSAIRVLELRSVRGTGGGPEKTIMLGAAQADPARVAVTVCYIRDRRDDRFSLDQRARALGLDYVEVLEAHSFDRAIWPALRRLIRERGIQIVHAHEYKTDLLALLLAEHERVIPLSTVHGWTGHSWKEQHVYYPVDRRLLRRYPRLVAVSGKIKADLVRHGADPTRIDVVLNSIDPDAFRRSARSSEARHHYGLASGSRVVGAVGRLEPQKRFDLLIDAVARLRPTFPDLLLVIAGDGSQREQLTRLASERLPDAAWRLLGHVDDVALLHEAIDVFVQSSDYEGTPNAVLEAMALETPIVATSAGGTAEIALPGVHGLIVPVGNVDALAGAVAQVLADPAAARGRSGAARRRVEHDLSFRTRMQLVEQIYAELLSGPRAASRTGWLRWQ